ncbi:MAG: Scr1 family TA system antitoxin-like transcriptional regulator [Candidatus Binatia bacterium]
MFSGDRPARFTFYLHGFVLRLPIGCLLVMVDQLDLLERMSRRPYLTLRVMPTALGAHTATAGSFILMEFAEFKLVAYLKSKISTLVPGTVRGDCRLPGHSCVAAQTALKGESKELIAALATELYADREDHDDRA